MDDSLQSRYYEQLERSPDRPAIAFYKKEGLHSNLTLGQLHELATGQAAALSERGLGRGDVCILVLPSGPLAVTLTVSILLLGAIPLLVAPPALLGPQSNLWLILKHVIDRTRPRFVICSESMAEMSEEFEKLQPHSVFLFGERDISPIASGAVPLVAPEETDVAAMQLTSGTTGFPRVCVWRHKNVLAALDGMTSAMKVNEEDSCFNWTPLYHDMGLVNNFLLCLTTGMPLTVLSPQEFVETPSLWLRGLSESRATITWSPNFGFAYAAQRVQDQDLEGVRLDHVRAFWNAAERIHLESMWAFHDRFAPIGVQRSSLKTNFGCAENIGGATFSDPDGELVFERLDRTQLLEQRIAEPVEESANDENAVTVVSAGRPYPGLEIKILSDAGDPLPEGQIGEIALDTPSRMDAYLGDLEATHNTIHDGLLLTGDLGYLRHGELFWTGRSRDRIVIMGKSFDASDLEQILFQVPGLREGCFAAFGVDDEAKGTERLVIVAEVRDSASEGPKQMAGRVRSQTFLRLGLHVSDVVLVRQGTLTKTSSGKRRHSHFRQLYMNGELEKFEVRDKIARP